ncbi:MAG: diacylglycerol kinase family protein [Patescibacteria group bacterium]
MMNKNFWSWLRRFSHALRGLNYLWRREASFRLEILAAGLAIVYAWLSGWSLFAWLWLVLVCWLVLAGEILNTILERLMDMLEPRFSDSVGRLKDMLAAVVLLAAILAVVVGLVWLVNK